MLVASRVMGPFQWRVCACGHGVSGAGRMLGWGVCRGPLSLDVVGEGLALAGVVVRGVPGAKSPEAWLVSCSRVRSRNPLRRIVGGGAGSSISVEMMTCRNVTRWIRAGCVRWASWVKYLARGVRVHVRGHSFSSSLWQ